MVSLSIYKTNKYYLSKKSGLCFRALTKNETDSIYSKIDSSIIDIGLEVILDRQAARLAVETACSEELYNLSAKDVDELYEEYMLVEVHCTPDVDYLRARLELAIAGEEDGSLDVVASYKCKTPYEFYGMSIGELTNGQLIFFLVANSVGIDYYESDKDKCVNLELLKKKLKKFDQLGDTSQIVAI